MHLKITDAPYFVKIPVRLKISVSLKISVRSENPYLKILVRWANTPERCKCSGVLQRLQASPDKEQESRKGCRNTRPPEESRRAGEPQRESRRGCRQKYLSLACRSIYKIQKMLKKICKYRNLLYLCNQKQ